MSLNNLTLVEKIFSAIIYRFFFVLFTDIQLLT